MCGIVGFTGDRQAAPILLDGLSKLEYRGYDSAGLAVRRGADDVEIVKAKGRLRALAEKTNNGTALTGDCGVGHTRWATHGEPNEANAHPHYSDDYNIVGVHNGIIENYQELREKLPQLILPVGVPAYHEHFLFAPFGQLCLSAGIPIPFLPAFAQGIEIGAHFPQLGLLRGYLLFLLGCLLLQSPQFLLLFQDRILQPPFF